MSDEEPRWYDFLLNRTKQKKQKKKKENIFELYYKKKKKTTSRGFEPRISCVGNRRLIH